MARKEMVVSILFVNSYSGTLTKCENSIFYTKIESVD